MDVLKIVYLYINDEFCGKKMRNVVYFGNCCQNVDLILNWLNCWDCSKCGNYVILLNELDIKVYIYIYIFILWNSVEKRIGNFDHNGILCGTIEYGSNVALHY